MCTDACTQITGGVEYWRYNYRWRCLVLERTEWKEGIPSWRSDVIWIALLQIWYKGTFGQGSEKRRSREVRSSMLSIWAGKTGWNDESESFYRPGSSTRFNCRFSCQLKQIIDRIEYPIARGMEWNDVSETQHCELILAASPCNSKDTRSSVLTAKLLRVQVRAALFCVASCGWGEHVEWGKSENLVCRHAFTKKVLGG